ncbi:hypothetical protein C4J81_02455 [Deltaproteobacteria bacterium Smac51]|nr:hypothetical protein C4J81_02455 [Deltaproteobacteria bacterium Smac51]
MAKPKTSPKKGAIRSPHTKKQVEVLKALEQAAKRIGLKVSAGQLRFAGLKLRGGSCLLHGRQWLILDKSQPFEELVDIYRQAISTSDLISCGLPDDVLSTLSPYFLSDIAETAAGDSAIGEEAA